MSLRNVNALLFKPGPEMHYSFERLQKQCNHWLKLVVVNDLVQLEHRHERNFDVILVDGTELENDVVQVLGEIRRKLTGVPAILLTDNENGQKVSDAAGFNDYLTLAELDMIGLRRTIRYALERHVLTNQLRNLRQFDHLTGLPNRLMFNQKLEYVLQSADAKAGQSAILFLDLDQFKRVNDTLGHDVGDRILVQVAERLSKIMQEHSMVARLGGDEFMIILDRVEDIRDVHFLAQNVIDVMSEPFLIENHEIFMTVSVGISIYPLDGFDASTLFKRADVAMYQAKKSGRNTYKQYQQSMDARLKEHLNLEIDLRKAIENDELFVLYQPQVDLSTGNIKGFEALLRWQHPELGLVSPAKFIPIAEKAGIIAGLDRWVLSVACKQAKQWIERFSDKLEISVNLSAQQFRQRKLPEIVNHILAQTGLSPANLCLEITESSVMHQVQTGIATLEALKEIGLNLSVDDFGTGHSSLNYLKRFPLDKLKVDRSFVMDIPMNRDDMAISTAIVVLAKSMALEVIAEGVETPEQLAFFKSLNCDSFQGFIFSKPVSPAEITDMLEVGKCITVNDAEPRLIEVDQ